jgi:hypothetical protein
MPGQMQQLLRKLSPTKRVLGVVSAQKTAAAGLQRTWGVALSDPYLSFATPLAVQSGGNLFSLQQIADEHDAKLVLVAGNADVVAQLRKSCFSGLAVAEFHSTPTLEDVILRAAEHPELYDFLGDAPEDRLRELASWDELEADHLAAVLLNEALWEHSGGWHNTFG